MACAFLVCQSPQFPFVLLCALPSFAPPMPRTPPPVAPRKSPLPDGRRSVSPAVGEYAPDGSPNGGCRSVTPAVLAPDRSPNAGRKGPPTLPKPKPGGRESSPAPNGTGATDRLNGSESPAMPRRAKSVSAPEIFLRPPDQHAEAPHHQLPASEDAAQQQLEALQLDQPVIITTSDVSLEPSPASLGGVKPPPTISQRELHLGRPIKIIGAHDRFVFLSLPPPRFPLYSSARPHFHFLLSKPSILVGRALCPGLSSSISVFFLSQVAPSLPCLFFYLSIASM